MKIKKNILLFFVSMILLPQIQIYAQSGDSLTNIVVLEHVKRNKYKILKESKKVKYWLKNDKSKYKGRLDSIADSSFFIGVREFDGSEVSKISARTTGMGILHAGGGILLGTGLVVTSIGGLVIVQSKDATGCLGPAFALTIGLLVTGVGLAVDIVGGIPFLISHKKYNLEKNWILKIEQVPTDVSKRKIIKKFKGK